MVVRVVELVHNQKQYILHVGTLVGGGVLVLVRDGVELLGGHVA